MCNFAGTPLKRGAWSIKKGAEAREKGVPIKCTIPKVLTEFSFGIGSENTKKIPTDTIPRYPIGIQL